MLVVIAGAGIPDLAAAQGFRRAGMDAVVLERDTALAVAAVSDEVTVPPAMEAYEAQVRQGAAPATQESSLPLGRIRAAAAPVGVATAKLLSPVATAAAAGVRGIGAAASWGKSA